MNDDDHWRPREPIMSQWGLGPCGALDERNGDGICADMTHTSTFVDGDIVLICDHHEARLNGGHEVHRRHGPDVVPRLVGRVKPGRWPALDVVDATT